MLPVRSMSRWCPLMRNISLGDSLNMNFARLCRVNSLYVIATKPTQLESVRHYAKGKQKEKARNKGIKFVTYKLPEEQLNEIANLESYRRRLGKAVENLQSDYIKHLSLRSTAGSIETVRVKFENEEYELQDIAQIIRKYPKTIVIDMIAFPQMIPAALQALSRSGLNINPQQKGTTVFVPISKVTKEHRMALAKNAKALFIKCRDQIKDIQNDILRKVKANSTISEDDNRAAQAQLTEMADTFVQQAEKIFETKQNELLNTN